MRCASTARRYGILRVYRAPLARDWEDADLLALLQVSTRKHGHFVVLVDFNLPSIDWHTGAAPHGCFSEEFLEWLQLHTFTQHVVEATRFREGHVPSLLDLAITRHASEIATIAVEEPLGKSDHVVLRLTLSTQVERMQPELTRHCGIIVLPR